MKPKLTLQYPKSTLESTNSYIMFRAYDYSAAPNLTGRSDVRSNLQRNSGKLSSATIQDDISAGIKQAFTTGSEPAGTGDATGIGSISLYLPQNLEYNYGANWKAMQFGVLGAASRNPFTAEGGQQALKIGATGLANAFTKLGTSFADNMPKTDNINLDNLLGASFGITFNDNTLQTFDKMETRTFSFKYVMVARDASEEKEIKDIIKFFKLAMHPDATENLKNNTIFLKYPYIWRIIPSGYKSKSRTFVGGNFGNTLEPKNFSSFLPNTKYCGLRAMSVNYTPNNVISLTPGNFVTAVTVGLEFVELTNLTRKDIIEEEDRTALEGYTGDQSGIYQINQGTGRDGTFGAGTSGFGRPSG